MYVPDQTLGWVHPKNETFDYAGNSGQIKVHFNSKRLRGKEYQLEKPADVYRVLVLGDSYAEGADVHVADVFTSRLETQFRQAGCPVEVINSGVGGYGTDQEALFLQEEGWSYSPDLVVLALTIDNDIHDNIMKGYCRVTIDGAVCAPPRRGSVTRQLVVTVKALLQAHLHTYHFVRQKAARLYSVRLVLQRLGLSEFNDADELQQQVTMPLSLFLRQEPDDVAEGWQLTQGILTWIVRETRTRDIDFAIILIPSGLQLDDSGFAEAIRAAGVPAAAFDRTRPNRQMADFGSAHSIPVVDLLESFRKRQDGGEQLVDGHWNSRGHAVAAEVIQRELGQRIGGLALC